MWKECESYKHKCAKEIVKGWIDSQYKLKTNEIDFMIGSQSRNRDEVWLEYPVGYYAHPIDLYHATDEYEAWRITHNKPIYEYMKDSNSINTLFDEEWDECVGYKMIDGDCLETNNNPVPTYQQCRKNNFKVVAILDIAVQHKGQIYQGIEICHKNPVSDQKIKKLKDMGLNSLVEIDADWVLNQVGIPEEIKIKRILI